MNEPVNLGNLFHAIPILETLHWDPKRKINQVTSDSRSVSSNDIFVACSGTRMDGGDFIGQAMQAGAKTIVVDQVPEIPIPKDICLIRVPHARQSLSLLMRQYYGCPDRKLKLIGVTGTNGKTTIAYLLQRLLSDHVPSAYIGTLFYAWNSEKLEALNTTPGPEMLYPLLARMVDEGIQYAFLEVSSHALEQSRIHGLHFDLAVFTQLTRDHLDYHVSMERYYQTKRMLFSACPAPKKMLINRDCLYGRRLLEEFLHAYDYSQHFPAAYSAKVKKCNLEGIHMDLPYRKTTLDIQTSILMHFNVSNLLAILGAIDLLGFDLTLFLETLKHLKGVPGRAERVAADQPFQVFVDYAHTPDAMTQVLAEAAQLKSKRLIVVFGCGGDRDIEKRPLMTSAAAQYADTLIMTSDNPRSEDPENILQDMQKGLSGEVAKQKGIYEVVDREEAIHKALEMATPGDLVFVLGKGNEGYQILGDRKIPFDDRKIIESCLKNRSRVFLS